MLNDKYQLSLVSQMTLKMEKMFFAYPGALSEVSETIENAIKEINKSTGNVLSWTALDVIGNFIPDEIFEQIGDRVFVADITRLNYNVTYEVGYAIGIGKAILLTKNKSKRR